MPRPFSIVGLPLLLSIFTPPSLARTHPVRHCAADPFADPKTDPCNVLTYIASNTLTGIAFGLYVAVAITHSFSMWKWGAKWMAAMVIGAYTFALGIGTRFGLHGMPDSKGLYIVEYLFVVLSPCAFIAADYVLLGQMALDLDTAKHLLVSPRRITLVFILSDVTTFLIQAAGGSVSIASNDLKTNMLGSRIFLAGLVLQLVSFACFTCVYIHFLYRVRRYSPTVWARDRGQPRHRDWRTLGAALMVSCVGILIRSVYRTIELSQGFKGRLATNEGFFYGLDTYPLFVAIAVYVPIWPGRYIPFKECDVTTEKDVRESPVGGESK